MDKLSQSQRDAIKKMSTARLITKLSRVGVPDEQLDKMDREALMNAWAGFVLKGKEDPEAVPTFSTVAQYVPELEKRKLYFKMQKW